MNELPAIYLFLFMNPELLMENFLSPPIGTMKDRTIDEVFPIMVQDQNIKTIFNFEVTVRVIINYSSFNTLGKIIEGEEKKVYKRFLSYRKNDKS